MNDVSKRKPPHLPPEPPLEHPRRWNGTWLRSPTAAQLLETEFPKRRRLLPWLREEEAALIYGGAGVGKSWLGLSIALAVAGEGRLLDWTPEACPRKNGWRVELLDGEMHAEDIRDRIRQLREGLKLTHPERLTN